MCLIYVLMRPARHETKETFIENHRWDPVTSTASATLGVGSDMLSATTGIFTRPVKEYQRHRQHQPIPNGADGPELSRPSSGSSHSQARSQSPTPSNHSSMKVAGKMALASASGVGDFFKAHGRGFFLNLPLATTEGLRNMPRLYGEEVPENERIKDWKSGALVGGKNFVAGMAGGMTDLFVQPYLGAREEGVTGAAKGLAKGMAGVATKTLSGKDFFAINV